MKKRILSLALVLTMLLTLCCTGLSAAADAPAITEKELPFYLIDIEDMQPHSVYYIGDSDVPYVSLRDWAELMPYLVRTYIREDNSCTFALTFSMDGETGILTREDDYTAAFDCAEDRITFYDYDAFIRPDNTRPIIDVLSANDPTSEQDVRLFRRAAGSYERYGDILVLDLASYGIDLVTDGSDCYVPLQTLSDFLLSLSYVNAFYNGEAVIFAEHGSLGDPEDYTELGKLLHSIEPHERSQTMADFTYAELCLALDSLYGLKSTHGVGSFDLLGEQTGLYAYLLSTDPAVADEGLYQLIAFHLDDLHSNLNAPSPLDGDLTPITLMTEYSFGRDFSSLVRQLLRYQEARIEAFPDGVPAYQEVGNTAYITFDQFDEIPEDVDYYETAPTAEATDTFGIMIYAYSQITREDSPVENVVLDLSLNTGGSVDAAIFVLSAFLGKSYVSVNNTMSGAMATGAYEIDINLDKKFDENDLGLRDKNLYCLISPVSFSCGNLVPSVFRNTNMVTLLGRTSGGGSCAVLPMSTADGAAFQISGPMRLSFTKNGSFYDIDQGAVPDYILSKPASFYNREALTDYINGLL